MAKKKPQQKQPQPIDGAVLFRVSMPDASEADRDERAFDIVLATEEPVQVFDFERGQVMEEVMLMRGVQIPGNAQIPLVDSHSRYSVQDVLGSIRNLRVEGGQLVGRAFFADNEISRQTFANYADGHLTDFSVGARILELKYDDDRRVVARSELIEGSAVVKGADPNAKAMPDSFRAYADPQAMKDEAMLTKLRETLVSRGLAKDADDSTVWEFLEKQLDRGDNGDPDAHLKFLGDIRDELKRIKAPESVDVDDIKRQVKEEHDAEIKRRDDISDLCRKFDRPDEDRDKWIKEGTKVEEVSRHLLDDIAKGGAPLGPGIEFGRSDREKFYDAALHALTRNAITGAGLSPHTAVERARSRNDYDAVERSQVTLERFEKPPTGAAEFRNVGLMELARMFCERSGIRTQGLPNQEIAKRALQIQDFVHRASDGPAYNTTGSFANVMLDAANKTLLMAYDEASVTYPMWVRQAPSAADFKALNRIRFGELPDPEVVPENHEYPDKTTTDNKESYKVEKHGELFSISMEAIVNDDMNAISRIPAMQGNAMRRKINKDVYQLLADNPTLSDGIAVFHASSHNANLDTTAFAGTAQLNVGFYVMMTQAGLTSGTVLNITPRYLICGATLSGTVLQVLRSASDPTNTAGSTEDATRPNFNSGVVNLYGPGGGRPLTPVIDGQIDSLDSTTAWYLAADPSQVDTMEITFLRGEETPVLDREEGFTTDSVKYKIRQTWGLKIIDYRGLYQGNT